MSAAHTSTKRKPATPITTRRVSEGPKAHASPIPTRSASEGPQPPTALLAIAFLLAILASHTALAQEAPANPTEQPSADTAQLQPPDNPLERAIRNMQSAGERIKAQDTGTETQQLQQQIVTDLDKLIELARQQPPSASQQPNPQTDQQQQQPQQSPQSAPQPANQQQSSPATQPGLTQQQNDLANQSTDRRDQAAAAQADIRVQSHLINAIWGHLPPGLRQQLLNIPEENVLPKYGDIVRSYFEALAEQGTKRDQR